MNTTRNPNSLKNLRQPWRPGESGNPSGNRKRPYTNRLHDLAETRLPEELRAKFNDSFAKQFGKKDMLPPGTTYADAEVLRLHLNTILKGDVASAAFISDRIEGKPANRLDLIGHGRQEVTIRVVHDTARPKWKPNPTSVEGTLFTTLLALIEQSNDNEDEGFLMRVGELAQMLRERAKQKARTIDAPKIA
jgi:hypothetical protein